ncbi:MAG: efflux transporter outer membrane subunit [Ramlibacter sp.]|jgi:NodT family efflux transporter outer membrane factor (OMF) lipoprotein|nr:efflux transporter outer membrane subunit [Ramlibacter sp.]
MNTLQPASRLTALALALALAGCAVGPTYQTPGMDVPAAFKESQGPWVPATPADALPRGDWWTLLNDPVLNDLAQQVNVSNQNIAAAVAAYNQARALVAVQRAQMFPTVGLNLGADRSGGRGSAAGSRSSYQLGIGASWEPDLFGRLSLAAGSAGAAAQAGAADLASARLASQGELAVAYIAVRQYDAQRALLLQTVQGYERSQQIAQNRYDAGIAPRTDVLQAQTQLANTRADLLTLERQRAQAEHAIAVLTGKAPASFSLPAQPQWVATVPAVPVSVPSTLLQRRPDIAARERRVAQANAQIGIAQTAYYPNIGLNASIGTGGPSISDLFSASTLVWAVGASLAQTLFSAGARGAQVDSARAGLEAAAAQYRQTVLSAFQDVEDQLVAARVLQQQQALREEASRAADLAEQQQLNRYRAGQVSFTEVISAQAAAQSARRALVQLQADRQTAAVALIQAMGGGWQGL